MAGPYVTSSEKNYVGLAKQASKGTGVVPTVFVPYMGEVGLDHGMDGENIREGGSGLYVARTVKQKDDPNGSGSGAWRPSTMGKIAAWLLGKDVVTGVGPYTHTLTPDETNTWLSLEHNLFDEAIERFVDVQLRKLTISGEGGGDLMVAFEWLCLTKAWQSSATTETYETAAPFKQDQATYTIDNAGATNVQKWSLELEWGVDDDLRLSKVTRGYLPKLNISGKLSLTQLLLATDDYRKVNYGSITGTAASQDFFGSGDFDVVYDNAAAGAAERETKITVPGVEWREAKYSALNPDGATVFLDRTGEVKKLSASAFATIAAKTGDSVAYV